MPEPVKGKTEAGRRREARARETRRRIVGAATASFLERGYHATTIESIAARAGVAAATVYQAFGSKAAVLARALDETIVGDDDTSPLLERDWVTTARSEPDPRRRLQMVVEGASRVAVRTAELKAVARVAAGSEPAVHELLHRDDARRLITQRVLVEIVIGGPPTESAVAIFYELVNSSAYLLATEQLGWDERTWRAWLVDVLARQLL
jgi:AcrR family transcriptional regulator